MHRKSLNTSQATEEMELIATSTPSSSPANTGLFKRQSLLQRGSLELRKTNNLDNCNFPVEQYLNEKITFKELINTLNIIPVDYIHFNAITSHQWETLQQHIKRDHAANNSLNAEYEEFLRIFNSDTYPHGIKTVLFNALCDRWKLPNNSEEKSYLPKI